MAGDRLVDVFCLRKTVVIEDEHGNAMLVDIRGFSSSLYLSQVTAMIAMFGRPEMPQQIIYPVQSWLARSMATSN